VSGNARGVPYRLQRVLDHGHRRGYRGLFV